MVLCNAWVLAPKCILGLKMSNISIIDDFLDLHEFNEIQDLMLGRWFPWYYNDFVNRDYDSLEKDNPNTFQFTHVFYGDDAPQSSFFQSLHGV